MALRVRRAKPTASNTPGVIIKGRMRPRYREILTAGALAFLAELHRWFDRRRQELLAARAKQQKRYDAARAPDFLAETANIRATKTASWRWPRSRKKPVLKNRVAAEIENAVGRWRSSSRPGASSGNGPRSADIREAIEAAGAERR